MHCNNCNCLFSLGFFFVEILVVPLTLTQRLSVALVLTPAWYKHLFHAFVCHKIYANRFYLLCSLRHNDYSPQRWNDMQSAQLFILFALVLYMVVVGAYFVHHTHNMKTTEQPNNENFKQFNKMRFTISSMCEFVHPYLEPNVEKKQKQARRSTHFRSLTKRRKKIVSFGFKIITIICIKCCLNYKERTAAKPKLHSCMCWRTESEGE